MHKNIYVQNLALMADCSKHGDFNLIFPFKWNSSLNSVLMSLKSNVNQSLKDQESNAETVQKVKFIKAAEE